MASIRLFRRRRRRGDAGVRLRRSDRMVGVGMTKTPCNTYANQGLCNRIFDDVWKERLEQDIRRDNGRFQFTCADIGLTLSERAAILGEEFGEVCQEVLTQRGHRLARNTYGTVAGLRKELVQVMAVALAWVEWIDSAGT